MMAGSNSPGIMSKPKTNTTSDATGETEQEASDT